MGYLHALVEESFAEEVLVPMAKKFAKDLNKNDDTTGTKSKTMRDLITIAVFQYRDFQAGCKMLFQCCVISLSYLSLS